MLIFLIIVLVALAALGGYFLGTRRKQPTASGGAAPLASAAPPALPTARENERRPVEPPAISPAVTVGGDRFGAEKARLIRSADEQAALLRRELADRDAALEQLEGFARDRERLFAELADARTETARYRQLIVDIENNAPPPILSGPGEPDDLKLIVGVGPVLERMLHNLGITTFRQIARWSARDIAEFDAQLPEFPGRIVRDQWVTQARALHESKYGQRP